MPDAKSPPDPSMDEILASIRRIIAEDGPPGRPSISGGGRRVPDPATAGVEDDVLELTEAIAADGSARHLAPFGSAGATRGAGPVVSAAASSAAATAFGRLAAALRRPQRSGAPLLLGDRSLDDIVREELRPLLQAWLDANLPGIVERLVAAEIARIEGGSGQNGGS
jgi:uncharacterized protein